MSAKRKGRRIPTAPTTLASARPPRSATGGTWIARWPEFLVFGLAMTAYLNALGNGFVYDARLLIEHNVALRQSREWLAWFRRHYWWGAVESSNLYRPLTVLSFVLNLRLTGLHPFAFHLTDVFLHGAVSVLVVALGRRLLGTPAALAAGLIFAVHPLHTEAVAWIGGRTELLAALFALVASLAFLRSADPAESRWGGWSAAAVGGYLLSLLSKEHAAPLPVWWALAWWLRTPRSPARRLLSAQGGAAAALALYVVLRSGILRAQHVDYVSNPMASPLLGAPPWQRMLTAAAVVARYGALFVWPAGLSIDYSIPQVTPSTSLGSLELTGLAILVGWLVALLVAVRRAPGMALALALVPTTYLVTSNVVFLVGALMSERFTYLPTVGLCLAAAWLLVEGARRLAARWETGRAAVDEREARGAARLQSRARWLLASVLTGLVVAMGTRTMIRNRDWVSDYTIFSAALGVTPLSANVLAALGREEAERGNAGRARQLLEQAVRDVPEYPAFRLWLADAYQQTGRADLAIEQYREAGAIAPRWPEALHNLGVLLWKQGRLAEAEEAYREALRRRPQFLPSRIDLGWLLHAARKPTDAMEQFQAILRANPQHPEALYGAAVVSAALGDLTGARQLGRQAQAAGYRVPEHFWRALGQAS